MNAFPKQEMREERRVGVEKGLREEWEWREEGRVGVERGGESGSGERRGESGSGERRGEWEWREEGRVGVERGRVGVERGEEEGNRRREREIGGERGRRSGRIDQHCATALMEALSSQLYGASRPPLFSTAATMS